MASEEAIKKLIESIMNKRRELGMPEWGSVSKEDMMNALKPKPSRKTTSSQGCHLAKKKPPRQNDKS